MTNRWSRVRVAVAGVAVVTACVGAGAGASGDEPDPATATEAPVTPDPTLATTPAVDDAGTRVGFIGLPPEGATPSIPEGGERETYGAVIRTPLAYPSSRSVSARGRLSEM